MIGGARLRQHVVEFIRGTGIVTDGIVDATSVNGPWNWTVPDGVATLSLDGCGAGAGGGGGWNTTAANAGGGGGGGALCIYETNITAIRNTTLTITIGAGGSAGTAGNPGASGGFTLIAGLTSGSKFVFASTVAADGLCLAGGIAAISATASSSGGFAYGGNNWVRGSSGGPLSAPPTVNNAASASSGSALFPYTPAGTLANFFCQAGCSGGNASTTPTVAGGNSATYNAFSDSWVFNAGRSTNPAGTTNTTVSFGAGGHGGMSMFGLYGTGGNGNSAGGAATGYGAGGGGGGGNAAGGAGGDGYVRFTYWSAD